jgi:superfamily II DNA or RNA helicase
VYRFDLESAIRRGILCPFEYIPVEYELTADDKRRRSKVFSAKAAAEAEGEAWPEEKLYRALAFVNKTAEAKPGEFAAVAGDRPSLLKAAVLFVETQEFARPFVETIGRWTSRYSTYFDDDPSARLSELSKGELDCLVCCKRLSEGVDIKHLRTVFLISVDRARLQTIQRIGRTLRTDPGDPTKVATVVDFVLKDAPPDHADTQRCEWLAALSNVRPQNTAED